MKLYQKTLFLVLAFATASAYCMEVGPSATTFSAQLKKRTTENEANYKDQPFFTLNIMQPTKGYISLKQCVNYLFKWDKFPENYGSIPPKFYHMSLVTFAVPFDNPSEYDVKRAMLDLSEITADVLPLFDNVSYTFTELQGIGTNKFIAAHYGFSAGKQYFFAAYELIVARFLAKYPKTWMRYGFDPLPHVSVASRKKPAKPVKASTETLFRGAGPRPRVGLGSALDVPKVTIDTSQCRAIADLNLLHKGRQIEVSGQFYNKEAQKLETLSEAVG